MKKVVVFDCDSTLSSIEGVDELARLKGGEVYQAVEEMTTAAMEGKIPVEEVFGRRLSLILPSREDVEAIGLQYVKTLVPGVREVVRELRQKNWEVIILSGGFRPAIRPLAKALGVERVEAVDLFFGEGGEYSGYDEVYPTTRSGGKPEVVKRLREESGEGYWVMVGDGVSDLETRPEVNRFIGFGGVVKREKVKAGADAFCEDFREIPGLLEG